MDTTDITGQTKPRKMRRQKNLWNTSQRVKSRRKKAQELPEEALKRQAHQQEYWRKRCQNETLAEKEERLSKSRNRYKVESQTMRERRAEERRLKRALKQSQMAQEQAMVNSLLPTGLTYETSIWKSVRDQLHQTNAKVIRLTATSIKHVHIAPPSTNNSPIALQSISEKLDLMPPNSCSMLDGQNSYEGALFEPTCVLKELSVPQNLVPTVSTMNVVVKPDPIDSDEEAEIIIGDLDVPCDVKPTTGKSNTTHQPVSIENQREKMNNALVMSPKPEQTGLVAKVEEPNIFKSELIIKTEIETEDNRYC